MNIERFRMLAEAYGADLSRWPDAERAAAETFRAERPEAAAVLAEAGEIDAFLNAAPDATPVGVLRERIIALAPRGRRPLWKRSSAWISGAGIAAACVLGVYVGASASATFLGDPLNDAVSEASTAFDEGYVGLLEGVG